MCRATVNFIQLADTRIPDVMRRLNSGTPNDMEEAGGLLLQMAIDNQGSVLSSINGVKAKSRRSIET
jgi:hypothetical protein